MGSDTALPHRDAMDDPAGGTNLVRQALSLGDQAQLPGASAAEPRRDAGAYRQGTSDDGAFAERRDSEYDDGGDGAWRGTARLAARYDPAGRSGWGKRAVRPEPLPGRDYRGAGSANDRRCAGRPPRSEQSHAYTADGRPQSDTGSGDCLL